MTICPAALQADVTILDLRRTVASLDDELARAREAADLARCQLAERERSAEELARAQAEAISHLEEDLHRTECELAELRDEHSKRAAPEVERGFVEEIERLQGRVDVARREAQEAIEDATEAAAARSGNAGHRSVNELSLA
jgi:cell division septum initiation protein DivIVA